MSKIVFQNDMSISFESCYVINGEKWFFANEFNALCSMNKDEEICFKGLAPGEDDSSKYLFADIKYHDNKLFLVPRGASALVVYNIVQNSFQRYEIKSPTMTSNNPYIDYLKFSVGVIYGEKLYMIPRTYPGIVIFDINSETLVYETDWLKMINDQIFEGEAFFWADYCILDAELVLASANSDYLVRRSFVTNEYSIQHIPNRNKGFSGIEVVDNKMFLCSRKDGQILNVDGMGAVNKLCMPADFMVKKIIGFSKLVRLQEFIYAIPMWANYLVRININNNMVEVIKDYDSERDGNKQVATCCAWIEGNKLFIDNNLSHGIDIISEEGIIKKTNLYLRERFIEDRMKYIVEKGHVVCENEQDTLYNFFNILK